MEREKRITAIGGLGRIGLPIAALFSLNYKVSIYDIDDKAKSRFKTYKKALFEEKGLNSILSVSENITLSFNPL